VYFSHQSFLCQILDRLRSAKQSQHASKSINLHCGAVVSNSSNSDIDIRTNPFGTAPECNVRTLLISTKHKSAVGEERVVDGSNLDVKQGRCMTIVAKI